MSFRAPPPDLALGSKDHILGRQRPVCGGVPLLSQIGKSAGQIIDSRNDNTVRADRAAAAAYTGSDRRLPLMALTAPPPDLLFAPGQNLFRRQGQVFGGVPFPCQIGVLGSQIRFPRPGEPPGAVGAVGVIGGAGIDSRLPDMPLGAPPPNLLRTAVGDLPGRQRPVFDRVPLSQQSRVVLLCTVIV